MRAQDPPPSVTVTINHDNSTPPDGITPVADLNILNSVCSDSKAGDWGVPIPLYTHCATTGNVGARSTWYLNRSDAVSCNNSGSNVVCSPSSLNVTLYANHGNFLGTACHLPIWRTQGGFVVTKDNSYPCPIDPATCKYNCATPNGPLFVANNWGRSVGGDGHGPGVGCYDLIGPGAQKHACTTSSHPTRVDFADWDDSFFRPDQRCCDKSDPPPQAASSSPQPSGGGGCVGQPVSCTTGNAYFDQIDAMLEGFGPGVRFVRSYNSFAVATHHWGIFGPGWSHSFEGELTQPAAGMLQLWRGNGVPAYFEDHDNDGRYDPSAPFNRESWFIRQSDGSFIRYFRKGGQETYNLAGRLARIVDVSGNTVTLTYDGSGQLTAITNASGRALSFGYTAGRLTTVSGPAGLIATYSYDGVAPGRLASVRYADAAASGYTFTYDPRVGAVDSVTDFSGRLVEKHAYDAYGRAITSEVANGQEKYSIQYLNNQSVVTDGLGNVTTYDFAEFWGLHLATKMTKTCSDCGSSNPQVEEWTYDDHGRVTSHKDGLGNVTQYVYDIDTGDLLSETDPLGHITSYTYDSQGRILTMTAADGGTTTFTHGPAGPLTITDPLSRPPTRIDYDTQGRVKTVTDPRGIPILNFGYNPIGDLESILTPAATTPTKFEYDMLGRRIKITDPLQNPPTLIAYDSRDHVTRLTDSLGNHKDFAYDAGGRRKSVTDALGRTTTYGYDSAGRLETTTDSISGITRYGYDVMSRLASITDARIKSTGFEYDGLGRVKKITYAGGAFETFTYDLGNQLKTKTDRRNVVSTFEYDADGRLTRKTFSDGTSQASYAYDVVGRSLAAKNDADSVIWKYDLAGELLSEQSLHNGSTLAYTYDAAGNRLSTTLNGVSMLTYAYNPAGQLTQLTHGSAAFTFDYDADSRRRQLRSPNGTVTTYQYDAVSQLTNLGVLTPAGQTLWAGYNYDAVGNRTAGSFENYDYDSLNRLIRVSHIDPTVDCAQPADGSDPTCGLVVTESYNYDAVGNRLSGPTGATGTSAYDDRNELLGNSTASFQYDANGNTIQKVDSTGTWTYAWNAQNQLTSVLRNGAVVVRFTYDALGRRVDKLPAVVAKLQGGATSSTFLYDGDDVLRETSNGATLMYLHGPGIDEPLAAESAWGRSYLHADGLGSIIGTTDEAGNVTSTGKYDSFGGIQSAPATRYAFTGREWDSETGLYYYRARYYDPKVGRFLNEDPIGLNGGINMYAYVSNNSPSLVDPFGLVEGGDIWKGWMDPDEIRRRRGGPTRPTPTPTPQPSTANPSWIFCLYYGCPPPTPTPTPRKAGCPCNYGAPGPVWGPEGSGCEMPNGDPKIMCHAWCWGMAGAVCALPEPAEPGVCFAAGAGAAMCSDGCDIIFSTKK